MKITAEFNSTEELISFIGAFDTKSSIPSQGVTNITNATPTAAETKKAAKNEVVKKEDKPVEPVKTETLKEEIKEIVPTKDAEIIKEETKATEGEVEITKEMVRERLGVIMKSGKQAEVKALVAKHGASKLPDLKEEEYAAVYQEAEKLL